MGPDLAVSNIAWPADRDAEALELLGRLGVRGLEVAPTKYWGDPSATPPEEAERLAESCRRQGLRIVAAQALLFGRPDLTIFEDEAARRQTLDYLDRVIRLCAAMGAEALVFGSPKNRRVGGLDPGTVARIAGDFFGAVADSAERHGTVVVLEANPPRYGADFVTTAVEAAALVRRIGRPGLRLHLDSACMALAGDDARATLRESGDLLHHVHVSEPDLAPVGGATLDHDGFAAGLRELGYGRWISIEMRSTDPFDPATLEHSIRFARQTYLS